MAHESIVQGTLTDLINALIGAGGKVEDVWEEVNLGVEDFKSGVGHFQTAGFIIAGGEGPFAQSAPTVALASLPKNEQADVKRLVDHLEANSTKMKGRFLDAVMALVALVKDNPQLITWILTLLAKKA